MTASTLALPAIQPIPGFAALDGCHCITSSLARIFHHAMHPLSEEMLLGLGAGMGFVYWRMKFAGQESVFVGGRSNLKHFYSDLGRCTGVVIREKQTSSATKAETELLRLLSTNTPVMLGGDMGMLPWFDFPTEYHFGGHTFVVCGYNGHDTILCSDIDQKASGVKKGFFAQITREQLRKARGSTFKPFPPKNLWFEFNFSRFHEPRPNDIVAAVRHMIDAELNPPIKNFGILGMRHAADEILKWPDQFSDRALRMQLFNLYIFIEIGGTGGGCFRPMYARFLNQAATITSNPALRKASECFDVIGTQFKAIAMLFRDAAKTRDLIPRISTAAKAFREIADREEEACRYLQQKL